MLRGLQRQLKEPIISRDIWLRLYRENQKVEGYWPYIQSHNVLALERWLNVKNTGCFPRGPGFDS